MAVINRSLTYTPIGRARQAADIPITYMLGIVVVFLAAMFNLVSLDPDKDTVALDLQVIVKLAIIALSGIYGTLGFFGDIRVRNIVLGFPGVWVLVIFGFYLLSVVTALEPVNAFVSASSILCLFLATVTALVRIGRAQVVKVVFFAAATFVVGSWFAYFFLPEIGVFLEPLSDGRFVERMAGLSHPNTLGQYSAFTAVVGIVLFFNYNERGYLRILIIAMSLGALMMCFSRASMMALFATLAYVYRDYVFRPQNRIRLLYGGAIAIALLMVASTQVDFGHFVEQRLTSLSKSGESEEIMTATGRLTIWQEAIQLIQERPLTGYGAASSKYLLEDYSHYTHNMVLNVALSTGVFGGLAMLMMILSRIKLLFKRRHPIADALVVLVLVNGLVENMMFSTLCGLPTMAWVIGLVWFQVGQQDECNDRYGNDGYGNDVGATASLYHPASS